MGKHFSKKSETQEFRNFGNLSLPFFEFLKFRISEIVIIKNDEFLKMMEVEDEESPDINFAGGISQKS